MTGVARGLQSRCWADKVQGGFDSHSPPPFFWFSSLDFDTNRFFGGLSAHLYWFAV